jgi:hypothetical protein
VIPWGAADVAGGVDACQRSMDRGRETAPLQTDTAALARKQLTTELGPFMPTGLGQPRIMELDLTRNFAHGKRS